MKKVISAINHPAIHEYLKNNCIDLIFEYEDIQYQEGLLEILQKSIPDVLILNEQLPGLYDRKTFIDRIRKIDKYFKIIIIAAKEEEEFKNYLFAKGIFDVLINEKSEIIDLIDAINKKDNVIVKVKNEVPNEIKQELQTLKTLLSKKPKIIEKQVILKVPAKTQRQEIIAVSGTGSCGKSDFLTQLSVTLAKKSYAKILNIDLNTEFPALDQFFGVPREPQNLDYSLGTEKNSCLNYMVDNIDKGRFDSNIFDELVVRHKKIDNLDILTGNYSLYACQNTLNTSYYKTILEKAKELYDFIFIDTSSNLFLDSTQFALVNATKVFFLTEGTFAGLRKSLQILELFVNTWDVRKEKIQVIVNKYNPHALDKEVIREILKDYSICLFINYDPRHDFYLNKNMPMLLKPLKKDEDCYVKVLENVSFVERRNLFERLFKTKRSKKEEKEVRLFEKHGEDGGMKC